MHLYKTARINFHDIHYTELYNKTISAFARHLLNGGKITVRSLNPKL